MPRVACMRLSLVLLCLLTALCAASPRGRTKCYQCVPAVRACGECAGGVYVAVQACSELKKRLGYLAGPGNLCGFPRIKNE